MIVWRLSLVVTLLAALGSAAPSRTWAGSGQEPCPASDDLIGTTATLPEVARAMVPGGVLRVLAIGSATLFGPEASLSPGTVTSQAATGSGPVVLPPSTPITNAPSERGFPRQMAKALEAAVPKLQIQIDVRGGRGMSASDMLALLRKEIEAGKYQLVLWQTGTVEAVRNSPPGEFASVLASGVETVEAAGANLVLIDPQYSRFLQTNSNLEPYIQALQQTASMPGVALFHRFDLMRSWASEGQIDLERTPKVDRKRVGEALHACLGLHLAHLVLAGIKP